ncbi:hypothetical protein BC937DRAFT_90400 [Endogone sp. FLAS-F59071]|nr:hypothetical protein BC937DRAFT_90400 [Endogone sp. FLAS-F59071]|eukprot:RUS17115.1 hypothetical protein BC937DRAFT_90400 [Endogone sp. FLAS-F59071]
MLATSLPPQTTSTLLPVNFALPNKEWLREQLVGKKLSEIRSPALVVDRTIVGRNTQQMRETARKLGVGLRVHIKTHKTIEGTELQLGEGVTGIVVSTMAEAHYLINSSLVASGQLQDVRTLSFLS